MANDIQLPEDISLPETKKLRESFAKAPKGYIGPKEIAPALQEIDVKSAEAQKQLGESNIRLEQAKREEAAKTSELRKVFYEGEKEAELAMPERAAAKAARDELAAAKFEPTKDTIQDIAGLFSLMGVVGMVIGKKNAVQGMYAMNGMMEGYRKGRKDLFTREAAEFDKQFKILQAKVESATKELEEARKLRIYDQKAGEEAIAIAVARSESPLIKEMTARLGIEKTINVLNQTKETVTKMSSLQNDLQKAADDRALRKEQINAQERLRKAEMDLRERLAKMKSSGRGSSREETNLRVLSQDIGNAVYNLEDLKSESEKKGKLPGGSFAFAQKFTGDLTSMILRYAANQNIDEGLQGNDALMLNLAFDIASAQSGGRGQLSDTKVRNLVSQMPLYEQPEETKATKWAALMTRVKEANKSMPEDKRIQIPESLEKYFMGKRYKSGEGDVSGKGSDDKGNFHWEYNEDRTSRRKVYD